MGDAHFVESESGMLLFLLKNMRRFSLSRRLCGVPAFLGLSREPSAWAVAMPFATEGATEDRVRFNFSATAANMA